MWVISLGQPATGLQTLYGWFEIVFIIVNYGMINGKERSNIYD